jgi:hypothetical protein
MTRTRFEVVSPPAAMAMAPQPAPGRSLRALVAGVIVLAALGAVSWTADRQMRRLLSSLDEDAVAEAARSLDQLLARQRDQLVAEVTVLADDNRIRATVLAPKFDEETVQDVLEDIRKSSGATLLAVLDASGKVQAVAGAAGLKKVSLASSSAVKSGFERPTSDVWTLPDEVQVVGLAPIRSGDQTPALLVKGLSLGKSQLATVETALGVSGAVFIGERIAAQSGQTPALDGAFKAAAQLADGTAQIAGVERDYVVRLARAGDGATAARIAWLVPQHHHAERARLLLLLVWCPVVLGALMMLILIANVRRTNGGMP